MAYLGKGPNRVLALRNGNDTTSPRQLSGRLPCCECYHAGILHINLEDETPDIDVIVKIRDYRLVMWDALLGFLPVVSPPAVKGMAQLDASRLTA